jgi:hypothetical protein
MTLEQVFAELQTNEELARRFSEKPEEVLKELGVEAKNLHIAKVPNPNPTKKPGAASALAASAAAGITICASAGAVVCASVGGDVGPRSAQR